MKEFLKKNLTLVLAFLIPIVFISIVSLSVYLPSLFVSTQYNFVYSSCDYNNGAYSYNCDFYQGKGYIVVEGKIVLKTIDPTQDLDENKVPDIQETSPSRLFLYIAAEDISKEITFEEASKLNLDGKLVSPDGVIVSSEYKYSGGIFGGNSSYGHYLKKGDSSRKINLIDQNSDYYQDTFKFIGWVLPDQN